MPGKWHPFAARRIRRPLRQQPDIAIMIQLQRTLSTLTSALMLAAVAAGPANAEESTIAHAITSHGNPKHGQGFAHFDFANPDAPKGGTLIRAVVGTYDSLNPFIVRGKAAAGLIDYFYPRLMYRNWDEPFGLYGYVAESIETPEDRSWITFRLNPRARFHDGTPITVDDVIFSMETLREKATPRYRANYDLIETVQRVGSHGVRFNLSDEADREAPLRIALMPIFSKSDLADREFDETWLTPPLGGGPYEITRIEPGRSIVFERVRDWWAADLPQFRGQFNFNFHRFDYYRDSTVALQAFGAGEYNYRLEFNLDRWASAYDFPAVSSGEVTLIDAPHGRSQGMRGYAFNTRRPVFQDVRVREALGYAFDFELVNRTYLYGQYSRIESFFSNSVMAASGRAAGLELALLEPFRGQVPDEVFGEAPRQPTTDGSGNARANLRAASRILDDAGWPVREGVRVNKDTGDPLTFEILLRSASDERDAGAFAENLIRLGVDVRIRLVDSSQYIDRLNQYDYDMIVNRFAVSLSPGAEQQTRWGSEYADDEGGRNYAGVRDRVVDSLAETLANAPDRETLEAAARALDRVLLAGHYVIPLYFSDIDHIAYWGDLGYVDYQPLYGQIATVDAWWSNE